MPGRDSKYTHMHAMRVTMIQHDHSIYSGELEEEILAAVEEILKERLSN